MNRLAGYVAATRVSGPVWTDAGLPAELISMSDCVADVASANPHYWDPWFPTPPTPPARHHVLAVGVPDDYLPALREDAAGAVPPLLDQPVPDWHVLGFELVGFDLPIWHTWLCLGGLVDDVRRATGVQPGSWGLIQDEHDARRAADWLTESNLGDPKVFLWVPAQLLSPTPPVPSVPTSH
jgi:hypothetical protein